MDVLLEFTGFLLICWLLIGLFRVIANMAEQYVEMCDKISSTRELSRALPPLKWIAHATDKSAKVRTNRHHQVPTTSLKAHQD